MIFANPWGLDPQICLGVSCVYKIFVNTPDEKTKEELNEH